MENNLSEGQKPNRWIKWIGSLISGGLFIWILTRQNWRVVLDILAHIPIWVIPAATILMFSGLIFNALRWRMLLRSQDVDPSYTTTLKIVVGGAFISNFLPSTIGGDVYRIISMFGYSSNRATIISSVIMDRFINVIAWLSLLPFAWYVFGNPNVLFGESIRTTGNLLVLTWIKGGEPKLTSKIKQKFLNPLSDIIKMWAQDPLMLIKALLISFMSLAVIFIAIWILAISIGIQVRLHEVVAVSTIVYVLTLIPVSINGYGLREVAVTTLYIRLGADLEEATTLALLTRFLSLLITLPGALWLTHPISKQVGVEQSTSNYDDPSHEDSLLESDNDHT